MFRPNLQFNELVSLTLMLLMFVALIGGQTEATAFAAENSTDSAARVLLRDSLNMNIDERLGEAALQLGVDAIIELSHFRGEDE